MTEHEIELARALGGCGYLPGSSQKRFARDMAARAEREPEKEISLRQRHYMELMAWRYRRQLPDHLVPHRKPLDLPAIRRLPKGRKPRPPATTAAAVGDTAQPQLELPPCITRPRTN